MSRPKLLIEQWLPIEAIGAECMRERGASSALPPLYFLHVWWARRPLTVSRAAILASLLPAYPSDEDPDVLPWPNRFRTLFPSFDRYKAWFVKLIGILGDPVAGRKLIEWAKTENKKLKIHPYGYARAFTINPSEEQLEQLYDLLEWTWGTREINFCDPMSGGGSIPFEAIRYGLTVHANELNPVASVVLKATLDYPARFGPSLVDDIRKYGRQWSERVRKRLEPFFPLSKPDENIFAFLWARTVNCPETGKLVPLSPNWWLRKTGDPVSVQVIADPNADRCHFEIIRGLSACKKANPDKGTIKRGTAVSPWTGETIDGDFIKSEAKAGRMGHQLYAVSVKRPGIIDFRLPTATDEAAFSNATKALEHNWATWESRGLIPLEERKEGRADWACEIYGMKTWADAFSPRQLLSHVISLEELIKLGTEIPQEYPVDRAEAIVTMLALCFDKGVDRNATGTTWIYQRGVIGHVFQRHDFSMKWSYAEFDSSRNLVPWNIDQVTDAYAGLSALNPQSDTPLLRVDGRSPVQRLKLTCGPAQDISGVKAKSLELICVDPPYYDNVQYAVCSDFFYVWQKRSLKSIHPSIIGGHEIAPRDDEAVANYARFKHAGTKRKALANKDYENKMLACFKEMQRTLKDCGLMTVMFTHKGVDAWDTLGSALIGAGFTIDASWPVHTEFDNSLHQASPLE